MKKNFITFVVFLSLMLIVIIFISDYNKTNVESDIEGKEISKEEYLFKDDLLSLGYSIDDINIIAARINNNIVKKYLLNKKYSNIESYLNIEYSNIEHIDRYEEYRKKNPDLSINDIVLYVEIGLDNDFYTNINEIVDYKNINTLINKYYKLPDNYSFDDLVKLEKPYSDKGNEQIRKVAYDKLIEMINNAKKENINLYVVSGYRTNEKQKNLFNNSVNRNGMNHALMYSAKPGHSEHQLGLAVDFNITENSFENTNEFKWLKDNSYKYGFTLRYKKGKENITGYSYEPWHYRYLGIDIATKLFIEDITYEEYIIKYNK